MRIALVVQRYGDDVAGGAELHARYVAELLSERHEVRVLTTTARDYLTWQPHYEPGTSRVGPVEVVRFPVVRCRDQERFAAAASAAFAPGHDDEAERRYLEEQGPVAPGLAAHLVEAPARYDAVIGFSFRYLTTFEAIAAAGHRALLVPTAEADAAVSLARSKRLFRQAAAIAYNSAEEQAMIEAAAGNETVPSEVVGIFSRIPAAPDPTRFRRRHRHDAPYLLYVGRIDRNKGCDELFDHFAAWSAETGLPHRLLLIGRAVLEVPDHPRVHHLGFLSDEDKFDAIAGASVLLVPSRYESLSMVTLEAMALAVPPLVNGDCAVLKGQIRRSNAGLYYHGYDEMFEALTLLATSPRLRALLGRNGRSFYERTYSPAIIAEKLERLLAIASGPPRS